MNWTIKLVAAALMAYVGTAWADVSLDGTWDFRFEEDKILETAGDAGFSATDRMTVPGCWDTMPRWYMKHGTGLYRRTFTLEKPLKDAVLVVDGMGIRARFEVDGRDLGTHPYPYARLELPVGPLAAGEHTVFAAVDNVMEWPRVKLARPYYDFYFYGGFYHGVKIAERQPKVFVRTLDYRTGEIEIEVEGRGRERRFVPNFKLWSPEEPNLTTIEVAGRPVRFGIRQVEARDRRIYLNGREIFLKGFNRHESEMRSGSATSETLMLQDIQRLKAAGGNFIRGAHYQQCERFLDLCDEMGVLVWEESLGWGNGQDYVNGKFPPNELKDPEFCDLQVHQTREMVRASFNHPSVIISGFLNECNSRLPACKTLVDRLIETVRAERTGRLVTFACNICSEDICCENVDLVSFNAYPGTIPMEPGTPKMLKDSVSRAFTKRISDFRKRYPDKPIMVSESGVGAAYGAHDPNASTLTEEFQDEYLKDIFETLWANPDCVGFSIWQMNDGRTRERFNPKAVSSFFGGSLAGVFDQMRRPKMSLATVRDYFTNRTPASLGQGR